MDPNSKKIPYGIITSISQLGWIIRGYRKELGVRQDEAASLAGVGTRFLSELERGKETAEVGKVLQVLQRMGLDVSVVPRGSTAAGVDEAGTDGSRHNR